MRWFWLAMAALLCVLTVATAGCKKQAGPSGGPSAAKTAEP